MAKRSVPPPPEAPLRLLIPHEDVRKRLEDRIEKVAEVRERPIQSSEALEQAEHDYRKWNDYNQELLKQIFTNSEPANEYGRTPSMFVIPFGGVPFLQQVQEFQDRIREKVHRLESILERLELIPLSEETSARLDQLPSPPIAGDSITKPRRVFLVHGHDELARETVARFLERLDFEAVILHEQPNEGRTLIEKLERHADVGFAVVLLTPDDEGRKIGGDVLSPRARQNVALELGYFTGRLGRRNVCALHKAIVELPSDYLGVAYIPMDEAGAWQMLLARELKASGFHVDMNKRSRPGVPSRLPCVSHYSGQHGRAVVPPPLAHPPRCR